VNTSISKTSDQDLVQLSGYVVYQHQRKQSQVLINNNLFELLDAEYDIPARHGLDAITDDCVPS
jgi:hypothetical protein